MTRTSDFEKFSSVKIGGKHDVLIINSIDENFKDRVMIGGANNLLVSDNPVPMAMLGDAFDYIRLNGDELDIGAATKSVKIYNFARQKDIAGFEFLKNIPGTLGGLIKMNAGLCGICISDSLLSVRLKKGWIAKEKINFAYRYSGIDEPIFGAKFKISYGFNTALANEFAEKRKNQPSGASFGSCFTNPNGDFAGRLIEAVGLKGYAIGGAKFSEKHANFLINFNNASFTDATELIALAKRLIEEKFGILLKTEVVIL
ncbi:MAG: UDP-N-acetylmuramate dehydrogenase [Campylobacter sp.]|nr:UDP-N-acetylmuramate dehydrogenase [Campylobacter sp.]